MLITEKQLCEKIQFSRQTVQEWRKLGLPVVKVNRAVRYDLEKVIKWMENR